MHPNDDRLMESLLNLLRPLDRSIRQVLGQDYLDRRKMLDAVATAQQDGEQDEQAAGQIFIDRAM